MPRRKLSAGLGRLVTNTIKLVNRIFGKAETPRATPSPRPQRPTPPVIQQTVISKSPIIQGPTYQNQIDELKKIIEQQQREIEQLKAERDEARRREAEEIEPPFEVMDEPIADTPSRTPEPAPVDVSDEDDELPFEYTGPDEDWKAPTDEDTAYTWQNFGSVASLDFLMGFLKNTELSGVRVDSPFFNMPPIQQHFILIDYVQFQHDANPALFYEGKKKVELENVPIWGAEFDRFIDNMTDFGSTNTGDGRFDDSLPDWVGDLIEEY